MPRITVGTFNVENPFLRYDLLDHQRGDRRGKPLTYEDFKKRGNILMFGVSIRDYGPLSKSSRRLTATVIRKNDPDILAVQEVENLEALKQFNRTYLKNTYPYALAIDTNDPRQIDVGLLSKFDIVAARTHQFEPKGAGVTQRIFSRDCLEVDVVGTPGDMKRSVMGKNARTVSLRPDGQWANKKDGNARASSLHNTQREAELAAHKMLETESGGELKVKREDGKIRSKDTIPPAKDPCPPKDVEH